MPPRSAPPAIGTLAYQAVRAAGNILASPGSAVPARGRRLRSSRGPPACSRSRWSRAVR